MLPAEWIDGLLGKTGGRRARVDLEAVARAAGVHGVVYQELGNADGLNRPGPNGRVIIINASRDPKRQRFTLAHEIAHMFFLGNSDYQSAHRRRNATQTSEEKLCDRIAAAL